MPARLTILHLEDDPAEARPVRDALETSGLDADVTVVENREAFVAALDGSRFDAILADYGVPGFTGLDALEIARARHEDVPFIFLTGAVDAELAVETLKRGATDCLLKDRLHRLAPAISQAVADAAQRKRSQQVERGLRESKEELLHAKEDLEARVKERTSELSWSVEMLQEEVARRVLAEESLRERSAKLQALAAELTLTEHRERRRLSQVLHDGLQQILVGAKYRLAQLQRAPLHEPHRSLEEIVNLIDEALETSRSLTAELSPTILRAGLAPALEWLVGRMQDEHGLTLDLRIEPQAEAATEDGKLVLFQAVRELIFNVVKHAGIRSASISVVRRDGEVRITVADKGFGFDSTRQPLADRHGGFGLFSLGERLALIGGRLEIDSAPGRGSRINVTAPAREEPEEADEADRVSARGGGAPGFERSATGGETRIRVLLVDDHAVVRQGLVRLILQVPDMVVVGEAPDGESAVARARELTPDVILMDIGLPGMDGIGATRIIHADQPDVHIVGLSMYEGKDQAAAMLEAGAVAYLSKSGPAHAVIDAIRACGSRKKGSDETRPGDLVLQDGIESGDGSERRKGDRRSPAPTGAASGER